MKSLITVFVALTVLVGCAGQPMPYSPELHAKVIVLHLTIEGASGSRWEGQSLVARPCSQAFNADNWDHENPASKKSCHLREFSVPDGGNLGAWLDPTGLTSSDLWRIFDFEHTPVYPPLYPFNVKASYNMSWKYERGSKFIFVPPYRFGPFAANKCYLAWFEPTPVSPYRENGGAGAYIAYELQPKSMEIDCEANLLSEEHRADIKALSWYTL